MDWQIRICDCKKETRAAGRKSHRKHKATGDKEEFTVLVKLSVLLV